MTRKNGHGLPLVLQQTVACQFTILIRAGQYALELGGVKKTVARGKERLAGCAETDQSGLLAHPGPFFAQSRQEVPVKRHRSPPRLRRDNGRRSAHNSSGTRSDIRPSGSMHDTPPDTAVSAALEHMPAAAIERIVYVGILETRVSSVGNWLGARKGLTQWTEMTLVSGHDWYVARALECYDKIGQDSITAFTVRFLWLFVESGQQLSRFCADLFQFLSHLPSPAARDVHICDQLQSIQVVFPKSDDIAARRRILGAC